MTRKHICLLALILLLTANITIAGTAFVAPQDRAETLFKAGSQQYKDGRFAEAVESFKQVVALRPTAAAYFNLGISYIAIKGIPKR